MNLRAINSTHDKGRCRAVLCHDQRVALDGTPAETVDAEAKNLATKRLAQLAARKTAKTAKAAALAVVEPKAAPALPPETPEQLRAALLRRSA
jgi:sRNA-binding protein